MMVPHPDETETVFEQLLLETSVFPAYGHARACITGAASAMQNEDALLEAVKKAATERDGRLVLRCADAFRVAKETGVELKAVGRLCNRHDIKIAACQLGCFK